MIASLLFFKSIQKEEGNKNKKKDKNANISLCYPNISGSDYS